MARSILDDESLFGLTAGLVRPVRIPVAHLGANAEEQLRAMPAWVQRCGSVPFTQVQYRLAASVSDTAL